MNAFQTCFSITFLSTLLFSWTHHWLTQLWMLFIALVLPPLASSPRLVSASFTSLPGPVMCYTSSLSFSLSFPSPFVWLDYPSHVGQEVSWWASLPTLPGLTQLPLNVFSQRPYISLVSVMYWPGDLSEHPVMASDSPCGKAFPSSFLQSQSLASCVAYRGHSNSY